MSKEIDISAIKEGDKVLAEYTVYSVTKEGNLIGLDAENNRFLLSKTRIKQHTPKAFDWAEVKQGMAFLCGGEATYYVAIDPSCYDFAIVTNRKKGICSDNLFVIEKKDLTRAPEHDVKGVGDE